ncbi:NUDIX hydrolase [Gilvibacter sp.]|uniref:NUDIX hydrolase n=1 Tax=Gilvibacter sp. TaxID=2729997 RepID=UPI003F4A7532
MNKHKSFYDQIEDLVPSISMDCVVFGYHHKGLHILLLRYKKTNTWALPGGFLPKNATMENAVTDLLFQRTGVENIFLQQFHTFSSVKRGWTDRDGRNFEIIKSLWPQEHKGKLSKWFEQRFVSTAFMALVDASIVNPTPDEISDECKWISLNELPNLALDHRQIIEEAQRHLRQKINYIPLGRSLLPSKFTMYDLQLIYEAILGEELDRGNFQRKMMKLNFLDRHEKLMTGASNKAPYLYSINDKVYDQLIKDGIGFG